MAPRNSASKMIDAGIKLAGELNFGGNGTYDIYRPNYLSPTTAARLIAKKRPMRIEPGPNTYPEPKAAGVEKYSVFCDRRLVTVGDIIIPNPDNNLSRAAVTVMNTDDNKEMSAFRSQHIGQITLARDEVLFTNVRFDYFGISPGDEGEFPDFDGRQRYRRAKAAMWWRNGLMTGMRLIETPIINGVADTQLIWNIVGISGNAPVLEVELVAGRGG